MNKQKTSINLVKLAMYILKRIWLVIICAAIGFGVMYYRATKDAVDTYTTSGTMFVTNSNPNLVNYGYASNSDFSSAVQLVNIYSEVIRSETVMQRVLEYRIESQAEGAEGERLLNQKYPWLTSAYIRSVISMHSVNETPMVRISCTTTDPQLSADICNAVLQVAPTALKDVVGAGDAKPQDFATVPRFANARNDKRQGLIGGLAGAVAAMVILAILFLMNRRVGDADDLTDNYTLPILSSVRRSKGDEKDPGSFLLNEQSDMDLTESYAKLRMNLLYTLVGKEKHSVMLTSAVSGEGKSTVAANLAISLAMSGKRILLIDADMRRACQAEMFHYDPAAIGLSDVLVGSARLQDVVLNSGRENLDLLPAGSAPPNPSELLESQEMQNLLEELEAEYDMVLLDAPPVNIVSDPLALSTIAAGAVFVVRQHFSDHREIRKALIQSEMTGLELLGFVFCGEKIRQGSYFNHRSYKGYQYYHQYETRSRVSSTPLIPASEANPVIPEEEPETDLDEELETEVIATDDDIVRGNKIDEILPKVEPTAGAGKAFTKAVRAGTAVQPVRRGSVSRKPAAQPAHVHRDGVRMERRRPSNRRDSLRSQRRPSC